eukprot:164651_1
MSILENMNHDQKEPDTIKAAKDKPTTHDYLSVDYTQFIMRYPDCKAYIAQRYKPMPLLLPCLNPSSHILEYLIQYDTNITIKYPLRKQITSILTPFIANLPTMNVQYCTIQKTDIDNIWANQLESKLNMTQNKLSDIVECASTTTLILIPNDYVLIYIILYGGNRKKTNSKRGSKKTNSKRGSNKTQSKTIKKCKIQMIVPPWSNTDELCLLYHINYEIVKYLLLLNWKLPVLSNGIYFSSNLHQDNRYYLQYNRESHHCSDLELYCKQKCLTGLKVQIPLGIHKLKPICKTLGDALLSDLLDIIQNKNPICNTNRIVIDDKNSDFRYKFHFGGACYDYGSCFKAIADYTNGLRPILNPWLPQSLMKIITTLDPTFNKWTHHVGVNLYHSIFAKQFIGSSFIDAHNEFNKFSEMSSCFFFYPSIMLSINGWMQGNNSLTQVYCECNQIYKFKMDQLAMCPPNTHAVHRDSMKFNESHPLRLAVMVRKIHPNLVVKLNVLRRLTQNK